MRHLIALIIAAAFAAPAFGADRCLMASQIDGFQDAKRDSVTLTAGARKYHVELVGACIGLDSAISVATIATTACFEAGDKIKFDDGGGFPQTCIARSVTLIPREEAPPAPTAPD